MGSSFRLCFWIVFGGMLALQSYFAVRLRTAGEHKVSDRKTVGREGWGFVVVRVIRSLALIVFLVLYALDHAWLRALALPIGDWLRWTGVVLGVLSLAFYTWSRATLGTAWSSYLQTRRRHLLVTAGPYARIRHPIYLALMGFMTSVALITANGFLIAFLAISIVDLLLRIPREERMMIEALGDEYETYMGHTGGLFPKIR